MKKKTPRQLQDKLWKVLREIAEIVYPPVCYTCRKSNLTGSNKQLSHLWPKASLSAHLKYDMRILRWTCFHCNINLGGNGAVFYAKILKEIGAKEMVKLEKEKQILVKADSVFYQKKIDEACGTLKTLILQGKK